MSVHWKEFYKEGIQYYNAMEKGMKKPEIFTPEIIHNIAGMSIEKFFMAIIVYNDRMPYNHTLTDLVEAVRWVHPVDEPLAAMLSQMDSLQEICSMDAFTRTKMTEWDKTLFADAALRVKNMAGALIGGEMESA
jgi:hypothetical protein